MPRTLDSTNGESQKFTQSKMEIQPDLTTEHSTMRAVKPRQTKLQTAHGDVPSIIAAETPNGQYWS